MQEEIIRLEGVSFQYESGSRDILKDIHFSVKSGEWLAIIGPNGSGKSTLAKIINGLLLPYEGEVWVKGQRLNSDTLWSIRRTVGMVFQNPDNQFVGATVADDIAFGLENNGIPRPEMIKRVKEAVKVVGMDDYINHEPARLSGGQKQRVAIGSILALRPDVIILDEATSMLDPKGRRELVEIIKQVKDKYKLTVISITHDIDEAALADEILVLDQGSIQMQDTPESVFLLDEQLIDMGLDIPFSQKLKQALKDRGLDLPDDYMDMEAMETWIIQSFLKM